jgi:cobalt-zinc-cadmium efflux system outer membrane protein
MKRFYILSFFFIFYAYGNDDILTIQKALEIASQHNPEINQIRQELKIKKSEFWLSTSLTDPELSVMKEGTELNSGNGFVEKRYTISQRIDFPLTTYFRLSRINDEEQALKNRLEATSFNLKVKVKSAYAELVYARHILELQKQQLKIARNMNNATQTRFEVGEASALDLMKTEIQIAEAQNDRDDAELLFNETRYNLFKIIGIDPEEQKYSTEFSDSLVYIKVSISQESILDQLELQPKLKEFNNRLDAAKSGVREAWSTFLPNVSASYYRQDYGTGYDFYGYEIGLNIPLWFFMNQRGHIQKANAQKHTAEWQRIETELEMKRKIEFAWHSYDNSRKTIERFRNLVRVKALKLRDLTIEGYQSGELDLLSLLEAQRTYINNEKHYFTALKDYYLNIIELEKYLRKEYLFKTE